MSHYMRISCTALTDVKIPVLKETVKRMNSEYGIVPAKSVSMQAPTFGMDAMLTVSGKPTTIGFGFNTKENGKTAMSIGGEFYRSGFDIKSFTKSLCYNYSITLAEKMIRENNYHPTKTTVEADGTIRMTVEVAA